MPNHFHFLVKQITKDGITKFIKQITNAYTEYFNKKYKRDGGLMQGKYKAVEVKTDDLLMHLSRYIHLNPRVACIIPDNELYEWSSENEYLMHINGLCNKSPILDQFTSIKKYEEFLYDHLDYARELDRIKHLTID